MRWLTILAALLLAGCRRDQPPAPTSEQSGQLDDAENMLNQLDNEKGAPPTGTAPSDSNAN